MKILSGQTTVVAGAVFNIASPYRVFARAVQVQLVGTSGSAQLQGRSDPNAPWVNLGTAFTASGVQSIQLMPQVRANVIAVTGATLDMWVDGQES